MFSVKHNQSPPSLPLYKPRGPPINTGWLGDLSSWAGRRAELSWAERGSRQWAASWCRREVRPVGDLPARQWPICYESTWGKMGENLFARAYTLAIYTISAQNPRECVNVVNVTPSMRKSDFSVCVRTLRFAFLETKVSLWGFTEECPYKEFQAKKCNLTKLLILYQNRPQNTVMFWHYSPQKTV